MLRSDLCDYSDAYIVVKEDVTLIKTNTRGFIDTINRFLAFKNNVPFTSCISKINNVLIDNAVDLDIVMPMYNLLEYSKNCRKTTESFRNYYRDEPNNPSLNDDDPHPVNYNADPITNSESFKYKSTIKRKASDANNGTQQGNTKTKKNLEIVVPLKYLSNFWRTLDMSLINCEVSLTLTWFENCALTDITAQDERAPEGGIPAGPAIRAPTSEIFKITETKLYVPVVSLSTKGDNNFLEQLKLGFKRTIKWNKHRSETTKQTKTNHLNCLIDSTFTKVTRLFLLSF